MSDFVMEEIIRKRQLSFNVPVQENEPSETIVDFRKLCEDVKLAFYSDWERKEGGSISLEIQKRAIIGYAKEKEFFKNRIDEILADMNVDSCEIPCWYPNLTEALYQENWGMAGLSEWFSDYYSESSSAKIIGENIFFMENGRMCLKPQKISEARKQQLIKAILLLTPEERMDKSYYETYLLDGTRVTIFTEPMAKKGSSSLILRRYIIPKLSFEAQAERGTIPSEAIPLFKAMVQIGYNVVFLGAVRTAKTSFLSTWQSYEDPALEGVMVETDPEIPLHKIMPNAPCLQLLADGEALKAISKNLLRSDADYFIMAEARDGIALDTAVRIASKGTKRMKLTFHSRIPENFPLDAATEIVKSTGGSIDLTMKQVAGSFDFLFHFISLPNKSFKRLKGIYQMNISPSGEICVEQICKYNQEADNWTFRYAIGKAQEEYGEESNGAAFKQYKSQLSKLSRGC